MKYRIPIFILVFIVNSIHAGIIDGNAMMNFIIFSLKNLHVSFQLAGNCSVRVLSDFMSDLIKQQ